MLTRAQARARGEQPLPVAGATPTCTPGRRRRAPLREEGTTERDTPSSPAEGPPSRGPCASDASTGGMPPPDSPVLLADECEAVEASPSARGRPSCSRAVTHSSVSPASGGGAVGTREAVLASLAPGAVTLPPARESEDESIAPEAARPSFVEVLRPRRTPDAPVARTASTRIARRGGAGARGRRSVRRSSGESSESGTSPSRRGSSPPSTGAPPTSADAQVSPPPQALAQHHISHAPAHEGVWERSHAVTRRTRQRAVRHARVRERRRRTRTPRSSPASSRPSSPDRTLPSRSPPARPSPQGLYQLHPRARGSARLGEVVVWPPQRGEIARSREISPSLAVNTDRSAQLPGSAVHQATATTRRVEGWVTAAALASSLQLARGLDPELGSGAASCDAPADPHQWMFEHPCGIPVRGDVAWYRHAMHAAWRY